MKKNVQIGVLTGLLLVPAAGAHADEANAEVTAVAIPYNVVAATTAEDTQKIDAFIKSYMTPLLEAMNATPLIKTTFVEKVTGARKALEDLDEKDLPIIKNHVLSNNVSIENTIKSAKDNIEKAEKIDTRIENMLTKSPTTASTFRKEINVIKGEYDELQDLPRKLVEKYANVVKLESVLKVMDEIEVLDKMAKNSQELRTKVIEVRMNFNALAADMEGKVLNAAKLPQIETGIKKAEDVEAKITAITIADASTTIPAAKAAYSALKGDSKYVIAAKGKELDEWGKSYATATAVIKQIDDISIKITAKRDINPFITKIKTVNQSYSKIASADLTKPTKEQQLVTNYKRLEGLSPFADIAARIMTMNSSNETYSEDLKAAIAELEKWDKLSTDNLTDADKTNLPAMKVLLQKELDDLVANQKSAVEIDEQILAVQATVSLVDLAKIRADYNALPSDAKKLVKNLLILTKLESQYKVALSVVQLIEGLDFKAKDFAKKTIAANMAFEKLKPEIQKLVNNADKLSELQAIAQLMLDIDGISPSAKDFLTKVETAGEKFKTLTKDVSSVDAPTNAKERLLKEYGPKLAEFQQIITSASSMVDQINALSGKTGQAFMDGIASVLAEYKKMDSTIKRSVTNAALLTALEKDYKAALKVFTLVEKLPANTDKYYTKKVMEAEKAYQKLTEKQKDHVYNYTLSLQPVLKIATLIDRIDKLKIGSKTYEVDTEAIRQAYDALTPEEQALVHNYSKLMDAESNMTSAEKVIVLIKEAVPTADDYIAKLTAARQAYDSLDRQQQKLVLNYKDLTTRERAVKPVLTLDASILALDPSNARTFISKYKGAQKAYEKLTMAERGLLLNSAVFTGELKVLFQVMDAINTIKATSKTFVKDTQAARALFAALPADQQAKVSNESVLKDHELNVLGGARVDALIRDLNAAAPKEFIVKVKEASQAYKALSSTNKKGVTLLDELKAQEKYIKPVEVAIDAIDGLSNPRNNLSRQFDKVNKALKKLDTKQMNYVTNIDLYSNLSSVIHVYELIEKLKPSDKYYLGNLEAAKLAYDRLSSDEKLKVTNYYKLQESQLDVTEVQKVITIIASISRQSSTFFEDVEKAAAAYKELPSGSKRQVTNYDSLKQAEKDVKTANAVMKQIEAIDPSMRTFESKTKSALKAYEKLTEDQKPLIANYNLLKNYLFELGL